MSRSLTAQDRSALIKKASSLPVGSAERKAILAGLKKASQVMGTLTYDRRKGLVITFEDGRKLSILVVPSEIERALAGNPVSLVMFEN